MSSRAISEKQQFRLQRAIQAHSAGNVALAEKEYRALIAKRVEVPGLYCNLANICAQSGRRDEADGLWKKALRLDPASFEAQMNLADSLQMAGDLDGAASFYRQVMADRPDFVIARYLLGNILKAQGRLDEAAACYEQVMAQQPTYTQAHFTFSGIHKYRDESDPQLGQMLALYGQSGLPDEGRIHLAFALAKAFEDLGDHARSFGYLQAGNDLRAREFDYDIASDRALMMNIIETFSAEAMSGVDIDAETSRRPIFIVGMPRSGTSLVEKILASHSAVHGAGELDYLFALGTSGFLGAANDFQFRPLNEYAASAFENVGRVYLEKIGQLHRDAKRVTDKMPFNMMMIGLIRIALPNAKIIHCVRDARDTCLSIYKQNFTTGNYRFAYEQRSVAQFHKLYQALMAHWHAAMPGVIHDVAYEALTQNPEAEIRKLLAACDLEFEQSCLDFSRTEAVVKTASAYQVRQPMYTSSVSLWKKYEEFLGPMLEELQRA